MDIYLNDNIRIACSPSEYVELVKLGALAPTRGPNNARHPISHAEDGEGVVIRQHEEPADARNSHNKAHINVDRDKFFANITPLTARFLLVLMRADGQIDQTRLLSELELDSGKSLRRPIGSAHKRIREASSGRIQNICSVIEPDGEQQERIYRVNDQALVFLRKHYDVLEDIAINC